ncbi:TPA: dicarboxylate transporter/tellurite-resistance protein TehA, partial [Neisseria bacilliformis]
MLPFLDRRGRLKVCFMSVQNRKFPIPLSYFSAPLGMFALGLAWRY